MSTATTERSRAIETTVGEFVDWVGLLADAAGVLVEKADAVAPVLTFDEAVRVLGSVRSSVHLIQSTEGGLSRRIADQWDAGHDAVLAVEGVLVEVELRHRKDRRHWDHRGLMRAVVTHHLEQAAAEGRTPDPFEVGQWLLDAALPSYWRLQVLDDLGIDAEPYCRVRDEIPDVEMRPAKSRQEKTDV